MMQLEPEKDNPSVGYLYWQYKGRMDALGAALECMNGDPVMLNIMTR